MFAKTNLTLMIFFIISSVSPLLAKTTGQISGYVINENGKPVFDIFVGIEGTNMHSFSDSCGFFYIKGIRAGEYNLKSIHVGYLPDVKQVKVQVGVTTEINFNLKKKIYKLETLTITPKE